MILELLTMMTVASAGDPAAIRYAVKVETRSWEPIAIKHVEKFVEAAVTAELSKTKSMRLERASFADVRKGDYSIAILGRFVEEAERFSVYLTFGPGTKDDLPTYFASDTSEPLGRQKRSVMQARIDAAARRAGERLAQVVGPALESVRLRIDPLPIEEPDLPVRWGEVDVPEVTTKDKAIRDLLDVRKPDHVRHKALTKIQGFAFDQQVARNAIERCVLFDPLADLRARCVKALAPIARAHVPTQRVLLHAMRVDVDDNVLAALTDVSKGFVGLSRLETLSTWLHLLARPGTPERAAGAIAQLVAREEEVANLEFAVAACLQQDIVETSKRYDCARYLLKRLPRSRQVAAAWTYLREASVYGTGEKLAYEAVLDVIAPRATREPVDDRVPQLLLDLAERRATGHVRYALIYRAGDRAPATPATIERLLKIAHDQKHATAAIRAAVEVAGRGEDLLPMTLGGLKQLEKKARWFPQPSRGNPYRDLAKAIERVERKLAKK
ncbi:MAG: hypothetical protein RIT81_00635 [Deltaproteobacteria bacterium]